MARISYISPVTLDGNRSWSVMTTQPTFSVAPALYSGTNAWAYWPNGKSPSNSPV